MWPAACGDTAALDSHFEPEACVVIVSIDGATGVIADYAVDCGDARAPTAEEAQAPLLPLSSVNWSTATLIGDASVSQLYAFQVNTGAQRHTAYVSAITGHVLMMADRLGAGTPGEIRSGLERYPASELGAQCEPVVKLRSVALDPSEAASLVLAEQALLATGLLPALWTRFEAVGPLVVAAIDDTNSRLLVFVTATGLAPTR
jgi:hypothetical protein